VLYFVGPGIRPDLQTLILVTSEHSRLRFGAAGASDGKRHPHVLHPLRSGADSERAVEAGKVFAVRIGAMALSAAFMSMLVIGPVHQCARLAEAASNGWPLTAFSFR
jgi:hypothetical protein